MELATEPAAPSPGGTSRRRAAAGPPQAAAGSPQAAADSGPRPARQHHPLPAGVLTTIWTLAAVSGLAMWTLLYAGLFSGFQEAAAQHALYATLRSEIAQEIAPPFENFRFGKPVAILRVPQAGIDDVVLDGTTAGLLERGPGLERDSVLPGQVGVSVILGRQTMFGGPFRHLTALRKGDLIDVTTGAGTFTYRVDDLRYPGDPLPPPLAAGQGRLILVTAAGSGWRSAGAPDELLYVDTTLVGKPDRRTLAVPAAVPASELPMRGDSGVLMPLVLWLQLLLLTVVGAVWVRSRWGGWQTWLVAAPALLAVLWVVSEISFQLLPNLL